MTNLTKEEKAKLLERIDNARVELECACGIAEVLPLTIQVIVFEDIAHTAKDRVNLIKRILNIK